MQLALQLLAGIAVMLAAIALLLWAMARSNWAKLASEFRLDDIPGGTKFRGVSGHVGRQLIVGGLTVLVAEDELGLRAPLLGLRAPFHPDLLIPCSAISPVTSNTSRQECPLQVATARGPVALQLDGPAGRAVRKLIESRHMA